MINPNTGGDGDPRGDDTAARGGSGCVGVRGCGEGRASAVLRACISPGSRWRLETRRRLGFVGEASPLPNEATVFCPVELFARRLPLRGSLAWPRLTLAAERRGMAHAHGQCRVDFLQPTSARVASKACLEARGHLNGSGSQCARWPIRRR